MSNLRFMAQVSWKINPTGDGRFQLVEYVLNKERDIGGPYNTRAAAEEEQKRCFNRYDSGWEKVVNYGPKGG